MEGWLCSKGGVRALVTRRHISACHRRLAVTPKQGAGDHVSPSCPAGGVGSSATALPASPAGASTAWQFSTGDTDAVFSSYVPQWNSKGTSLGPWCTFASSVRHLSMMVVWHKQNHTQRSCPVWFSCRFRNSFGLGSFKEAFFKEPIWVTIYIPFFKMTLEPASLQLSVRLMACPSWQFQHFTWGWASHFLIHRCHPCSGHSCWAYGNVDTNIMGPVQGTTRLLCLCPVHRWKQAFQFMLGTLAKSAGIGFASSLQILNFYKLMKKKLIGK